MTELDLGLKVGVRRLLWQMGYSTRLDVELRGERATRASTKTAVLNSEAQHQAIQPVRRETEVVNETFTDLDVLGVMAMPGFRISTTIADCKSGKKDRPAARMFWARGVADLFGADEVMLVREHEVSDATRQLSSRLRITVLPSKDLSAMQDLYGVPAISSGDPLGVLFERSQVERNLSVFSGLDRRLNGLLEYREFDFWVYEQYRNPIQLVAHLQEAAKHLDARNPIHLGLFLDLSWLYTLALIRVAEYVRGAFLHDIDRGIQEYLFGGATNLREKREIADLLSSLAPAGTKNLTTLPGYYAGLKELVSRLLRRPNEIQTALRYAEAASALMSLRQQVTLSEAFGPSFNPIAAKLVADVCGFLVAAAGLSTDFRGYARTWLLAEEPPHARRPQSDQQ